MNNVALGKRDKYMEDLFSIALALCVGLLITRLFKVLKLNFPDVTAFLIAGLIIGPYCFGKLGLSGLSSYEKVKELGIISSVALGFIAFSIGNEFKLSQLKGTGKQATVIGIFQAVTAMIIVDIILIAISLISKQKLLSISSAITLGSIATATAPAATLMVVKQYKAKGPLTDLLLPIVALDDAVGLVCFAISFGIAQALIYSSVSIVAILINPIIEIIASLLLGSVMGILLTWFEKLFFSNSNRLALTIAFVLFTIALSSLQFNIGKVSVSFSSLLVCMMLGTMFCNLCPRSGDIMKRADQWTGPINILFFVLSGAELELEVFKNPWVVVIGLIYVITRSFGKYYGARFSSEITGCDKKIQKYLGYTLLPQAGVALGMCQQSYLLGPENGRLVRNIVLFAVLIYELAGPSITHWALKEAGDIEETPEHKKTHDRFDVPKEHRV